MTGTKNIKMDHIYYNRKVEKYREIVERHTQVKLNKLTREFDYVFARACYYYLCRNFGEMSFAKIAKSVNKNHATVMHSLKELPYIIKHDSVKSKIYNKIVKEAEKDYVETKNGKSIERLVTDHNFYLMQCENLKTRLEQLDRRYKKIFAENLEMKRIIYIMADTD